jgi:hypothetical protein
MWMNRKKEIENKIKLVQVGVSLQPAYQTVTHTVTNTRCHIDTVISPGDGHIVARNM